MLICSFQVSCWSKVTPSNFAVGSCCIDLPFDENTIVLSLSLLKTRPLFLDHFKSSEMPFSSVLLIGIVFAIELDLYMLVLSAY